MVSFCPHFLLIIEKMHEMRSLTIPSEITEKEAVKLSLNELKSPSNMATVSSEWKRLLLCSLHELCSQEKYLFILKQLTSSREICIHVTRNQC